MQLTVQRSVSLAAEAQQAAVKIAKFFSYFFDWCQNVQHSQLILQSRSHLQRTQPLGSAKPGLIKDRHLNTEQCNEGTNEGTNEKDISRQKCGKALLHKVRYFFYYRNYGML